MALNPTVSVPPATAIPSPIFIDAPTLRSILTYKSLINHLKTTLPTACTTIKSPLRQSHQTSPTSSLLLMPSWSLSPSSLPYIGVKLVTAHPTNSALNLPGVHASYVLFNSVTGQSLATMDGTELTLIRTACTSALASHYLSIEDSKFLLVIGAGSLAPHLIRAHLSVRPGINRIGIWNRRTEKAKSLAEKMRMEEDDRNREFEVFEDLEMAVGIADIVSCATNSETPLVVGSAVKLGAHVDLVGSYTPAMRECDDELMRRGRIFVDNEAAVVEAGEVVGAVERGVITSEEIEGNLVDLINGGERIARKGKEEITVFKSVGSAVVDLVSAQLVYETCINSSSK